MKIKLLFPQLVYTDECTKILEVDFEKYNNSLLCEFINETFSNLYNI